MSSLEELDLSNNKMTTIKDTRGLISIKKITLSHNLIDSGLDRIKNLDRVIELNIEDNPISRKPEFMRFVKTEMPKLLILNNKKGFGKDASSKLIPKPVSSDKPVEKFSKHQVIAAPSSTKESTNNVIKIIHTEWEREVERLKKNYKNYEEGKGKASNEKCLVQSGHAEIESNKMLFIYGNAMEVLKRVEFYPVVEEIYLE